MKRTIRANSINEDIRSGLSETELMAKHRLTLKGLQRLFKELVHAKIVTHEDMYERFASYRQRIDQLKQRQARRVSLSVRLPVYDASSASYGILRDISETGLRVAGIEYEVGDVTTFQLPIDSFMNADPLLVIAKCRWVSEEGKKIKYFVAGFELLDLSSTDRKVLNEFISLLTLSDSGQWNSVI
ncbi:MAG TPA: PilZ domain-containing protein [Desulfomonilaceae bacterium]|nr:PilZ domain-containing protein [Desulfomonilaceae bacterium]